MPTSPTLVVHGWSDVSGSFGRFRETLAELGVSRPGQVYFADYESREDFMSFNDAADGLERQLRAVGLVDAAGEGRPFNVLTHSTGALVVRHWIWRYYLRGGDRSAACPVRRLVMLAPANFGSPLAHHGKSLAGRIFKGRRGVASFLESGRRFLEGLELGSPYQWRLAHRDLLGGSRVYQPEQRFCTVLCGTQDYGFALPWANKAGTDGAVVVAGTPMDAAKFTLDFTPDAAGQPIRLRRGQDPRGLAVGLLGGLDHTTIHTALHRSGGRDPQGQGAWAREALRRALTVDSLPAFARLREELAAVPVATGVQRFQQVLVHAVDDHGQPIRDFHLQFAVRRVSRLEGGVGQLVGRASERRPTRVEREHGEALEAALTREFHRHTVSPSHRRFLVEPAEIGRLLDAAAADLGQPAALCMKMHVPRIDRSLYYDNDAIRMLVLARTDQHRRTSVFHAGTTTLLELRVNRENHYVQVGKVPRKKRRWEKQA
ncbi:esterase/lipase family protein [Phycisphaera mikurensis]|uniref:Uncharacterized protein n=1 Tax=Phycisphaera mikurensis (strain NBRC 102666 / KCTC 22515 / FYK2301M01) TaxID=1142394 RepID=I0IBH4_PHYMF|nr:hypothetical protein [Phycisphaera mikurensis]MBB6442856.1 hypothetical protein [Phycisphaera mikurensis]BAM02612.1 hypothetical protein PSMK_04530 [Phycisphaera mikurensis NBRC 102666]